MARSRVVLPVAVVLLVVSAGCMGGILGGGGSPDGATPDGTATPTQTPADQAQANAVREDALAAMAAVTTYRVEGRIEQRYTGETNQTAVVNTTTAVNRTNRSLRTDQSQSAGGRTYDVETYLVDGTLYSGSDFYVGEYGSRWLSRQSGDANGIFDRNDVLARHRTLLSAANVTLYGSRTVNGTETRLLVATIPPDVYEREASGAFETPDGAEVTVREVRLRYYLDAESSRPVAVEGTVDLTLDPRIGPPTSVAGNLSLTYYGYGSTVNVTLPEEARNARSIGEADGATVLRDA